MKIIFDYGHSLARQCEIACAAFESKTASASSERIFTEISKRLTKDFLPPIEREDIASLSFSLLEITAKAKQCSCQSSEKGLLKKQLDGLSDVVQGLVNKTKTCGDNIRRLININLECSELFDNCALNSAISEFLKIAQTAYFKNL